jgi:hypothetical protein
MTGSMAHRGSMRIGADRERDAELIRVHPRGPVPQSEFAP